jgi:nitrogen fixation protein NifU and related proteins
MFDLRELYQEVIVDHNRNPRNFHVLEKPCCSVDGFNPLCGDKLTLFVRVEADVISEASFQGRGCAISIASASLMTDAIRGLSVEKATELFNRFHEMVTCDEEIMPTNMDKLTVLAGVREFPARVKCATLAWHTLTAALEQDNDGVVSTE